MATGPLPGGDRSLGPTGTPHSQEDLQIHKKKTNPHFPKTDENAGPSVQSMNIYLKLLSSQGCGLGVNNIDGSVNLLGLNPSFVT